MEYNTLLVASSSAGKPGTTPGVVAASGPDVDAWARGVLQSLGVSPAARGTGGAPLAIPIDGLPHRPRQPAAEDSGHTTTATAAATAAAARVGFGPDHPAMRAGNAPPQRPRSRRDSQVRREALLKGKEGSRQRRRWENDRLMNVPNAQPPLPSDWEMRPTHRVVHGLPYHVAQYWDKGLRQQVNEARAAAAVRRRQKSVAHDAGTRTPAVGSAAASSAVGVVTRELRATAKKTPAVKLWVRVLEEPVRAFLAAATVSEGEGRVGSISSIDEAVLVDDDIDDDMPCYSDDEVVFVGRQNMGRRPSHRSSWVRRPDGQAAARPQPDGLVFDALGDDQEGSFKRWLTHSIADYYGLTSHTASTGSPPRRIVYVTLPEEAQWAMQCTRLPRPMWELF